MDLLRSNRHLRLAVVPATLALAMSLAACDVGDDDPGALDEADTEAAAATDDTVSLAEDDSLEGLEVTVTGNVTEVVDDYGFRVDKDGLGGEDGSDLGDLTDDEDDIPFVQDANFYDYDYYTSFDEEFGAGEDEGVLVFDSTGTTVATEQPVQVSGAIRRFDESTLEDYFDLDLDDDAYQDLDQVYVIVADTVTPADAPGGDVTATPTPTDSISPLVSEVPTAESEDPAESPADDG